MNGKTVRIAVLAAACGLLSGWAQAAEPAAAQVHTYRVELDASGGLRALQPLPGQDAADGARIAQELRHWLFEPAREDGRPVASESYVRVLARPGAAGAPPQILQATAGPAPSHLTLPELPADVRRQGKRGVVVLRLQTDAEGRVAQAAVAQVQGDVTRAMARAAVAAAQDWRFLPERVDGRAVAAEVLLPVCFQASQAREDCQWTGPNARAYGSDTVLALDPRVRLRVAGR